MIQLDSGFLIFQTETGETYPCSVEALSVELLGQSVEDADPELIQHAAGAVLHHFKRVLHRQVVTVKEFSDVLAKVMRDLGFIVKSHAGAPKPPGLTAEVDLSKLAKATCIGFELAFYQALRQEIQRCLLVAPPAIHVAGLREAALHLAGARRWNRECREMCEAILVYLRGVWQNEAGACSATLIVK